MVAALGVRRSQGTSPRFSGAKILAASAPGCVLAPLAFFGAFLPLQKREEKSWAERARKYLSSNDPSGIWDTAVHVWLEQGGHGPVWLRSAFS